MNLAGWTAVQNVGGGGVPVGRHGGEGGPRVIHGVRMCMFNSTSRDGHVVPLKKAYGICSSSFTVSVMQQSDS
jgi:hypothetical protein